MRKLTAGGGIGLRAAHTGAARFSPPLRHGGVKMWQKGLNGRRGADIMEGRGRASPAIFIAAFRKGRARLRRAVRPRARHAGEEKKMVYFCDGSGNALRCVPERVYQGSSEAGTVVLAAPFAAGAQVSVAFRLPNGECTPRRPMESAGSTEGLFDAEGKGIRFWTLRLPDCVTSVYGEVTAQFFRATAEDVLATAAARFTVEPGVSPAVSEPGEDAFSQFAQALAGMGADLENGAFSARSVYAWNAAFTYGANEIAYCPEGAGGSGSLVRSKVSENDAPPYENGAINGSYWEEEVSFGALLEGAQAAQQAAQSAGTDADAAEGAAEDAADSASAAAGSAAAAASSATAAAQSAEDAADDAAAAAASAELARTYAEIGIQPNTQYASFSALPAEGSTKFIYLVPTSEEQGHNAFDEYIWVPSEGAYEFIGSTEIDLSEYAKQTGSYAGMTVGSAAAVTGSIGGKALTAIFEADGTTAKRASCAEADGEGNAFGSTYAKQTGTYTGMTVGNAWTAINANYASSAGNVAGIYAHYLALSATVGSDGDFIRGGAVLFTDDDASVTSLYDWCTDCSFAAGEKLPLFGVYCASGTMYPLTAFYINEYNQPCVGYIGADGTEGYVVVYLGGTDRSVELQE